MYATTFLVKALTREKLCGSFKDNNVIKKRRKFLLTFCVLLTTGHTGCGRCRFVESLGHFSVPFGKGPTYK